MPLSYSMSVPTTLPPAVRCQNEWELHYLLCHMCFHGCFTASHQVYLYPQPIPGMAKKDQHLGVSPCFGLGAPVFGVVKRNQHGYQKSLAGPTPKQHNKNTKFGRFKEKPTRKATILRGPNPIDRYIHSFTFSTPLGNKNLHFLSEIDFPYNLQGKTTDIS